MKYSFDKYSMHLTVWARIVSTDMHTHEIQVRFFVSLKYMIYI